MGTMGVQGGSIKRDLAITPTLWCVLPAAVQLHFTPAAGVPAQQTNGLRHCPPCIQTVYDLMILLPLPLGAGQFTLRTTALIILPARPLVQLLSRQLLLPPPEAAAVNPG